MAEVTSFTSSQILSIKNPFKLFDGKPDEAKKLYRVLAAKWHPDKGGDEDVFKHVKALYERFVEMIENGIESEDVRRFRVVGGKVYEAKVITHKRFEIGDMYVTGSAVIYVIDKGNSDLVDYALGLIESLKYADDKMRAEFQRYMPSLIVRKEFDDGKEFVVFRKTPDLILLRDVLDHFGGKIEPLHVAWMVSRMSNIAAFLTYNGICHGHISPDTLFVSPQYHSLCLFGGWWYSTRFLQRIVALPQRTLDLVPGTLVKEKLGDYKIDGHLLRSTGLELMGSVTGSALIARKDVPRPMLDWLRSPPKNPMKAYSDWMKVLVDSFGPRKFVEFNVGVDDVYPNKEK